MAALILLLNGVTDSPLKDLKGKTPLEVAKHPYLDSFLTDGELISIRPPSPETFESSFLSLLSGKDLSASQAIFEAISLGHSFSQGEAAWSCQFASLGSGVITDTALNLLTHREGELLCQILNQSLTPGEGTFYHLEGNHAVMTTRSPLFTNHLPLQKKSPVSFSGKHWTEALPGKENSLFRERVDHLQNILEHSEINKLKQDFEEPPINGILFTEGALWSKELEYRSILPKASLVISNQASVCGISQSLDVDLWKLPKEDEKFSHIPQVLHYLPELLATRPLVIWDLNYLWTSTFNGSLLEKVKTIEYLDRKLLSPLKELLSSKHSLSLLPLTHTSITHGEPCNGNVPAIYYPKRAIQKKKLSYSEKLLREESCSEIPLSQLLSTLPQATFH